MICSEVQEIGIPERFAAMTTTLRFVAALEKSDVTVMRQDFRPQLQVCGRFEDQHLRRVHDDRVDFVHLMAKSRTQSNPDQSSTSRLIHHKKSAGSETLRICHVSS